MKTVKLYTTSYCPYCQRAKQFFDSLSVSYEEIDVEKNQELRQQLVDQYQWQTVPMIFVEDHFIGGFDDLLALHQQGKFLPMLK